MSSTLPASPASPAVGRKPFICMNDECFEQSQERVNHPRRTSRPSRPTGRSYRNRWKQTRPPVAVPEQRPLPGKKSTVICSG